MSRPLNILFITAHLPSVGVHAGGGRMFHLIKGLAEYHHISLLSYIAREEDREHIPAIQQFCRKVQVILRGRNPKAYNPLCLKPRRLLVEYLNPEMALAVSEELATQAYDLCQVEYIESAAVLPAVVTVPTVLTHHEVQYAGLFRAAGLQRPLSSARWGKVFRGLAMLNYEINTLRKFDAVLAMCEDDAHAVLRFSPDLPLGVSPMGVATDYFRPDERDVEPESMIYIGYYEHFPNEDAVVYFVREILPIVRRKIPNAKFYIVGSHPSDAVHELGRLDNVVVTGRVPDLRPWLARAAVFVAPIRLGRGMRGKILEAMAMRRPVVGSSVALAGFGITHGSEAMIADTPAAFAEAVVQVLSDTSLRERIALGGYEMVKTRYDWAVQVQAYHRLYRWLAGQGRRVVGPWREGGTKRNRDSKTVFASTLVARLNHILLPVGLGYLTPKAAWMLLAAHLRDSYRDYLRRSGRRPRTWGIPSLDFGFTSDSLGPAPARRDDRPPHGPDEARRLIAEREELIARVCDLEQENRRLIDERDTKKTDREMATIDGVALPRRSDDEPALERRSLGGPNRMELPRTPEESGWNSLQMRVDAIEGKLSDIKVRSAELEASLHKLRQDGRRHEVRARQESAAAR